MQAIERSSTSIGALAKAARSGAMLSQVEEQDLARLAQQGNQRAFERLVHAHIPLVFAIASEFRSYGLPAEELMSEGLLGLVKAARGFDPERGTRLASYAAWWIRAYLRSYTISNRRIVRGPSTRNARKTLAWLRRTERELARSTGGPPDLDAVASVLGVKTSDVEEARAILGKRDLPYGTAGEAATSSSLPRRLRPRRSSPRRRISACRQSSLVTRCRA
jgi:RNA polymerase sigma-32 factor